MGLLKTKITTIGVSPKTLMKNRRAVTKQVLEDTGIFWHSKFSHKHFTTQGAIEYGYKKRKGERLAKGSKAYKRSYTGRKERRFGHTLPLVHTGKSRDLAKIRDVRASSKRVRIVIHARALNFKHPKSQIDMREEMTTFSRSEEKRINRHADRRADKHFNSISSRETKTIG